MFKLGQNDILEGKADSIRRAIELAILEDRLKPGDALPTVRTLAADLGINKNTVAVAYRQLQQTGLVVSDGRRGSIVARQTAHGGSRLTGDGGRQTLSVRDGNPDLAFLPGENEIRDALSRMNVAPYLYGEQRNYAPFMQWAADCFGADQIEVKRAIFVSAGALDLIERALSAFGLMPGDKVAVEDPGYISLLLLVRSRGLVPVPLKLDQHGIVPSSLDAALKAGAKAVLFSSRAQNPTGIATTKARAAELQRLAATAPEVLFVDDDHSSMLNLAPYYAWHSDHGGAWLTVRSRSKFLGPDYRIAVSAGDPDLIEQLENQQSVGMGWVSTFLQRLVHELLTATSVQKQITAAGLAYRERYATLLAALKNKGFNVMGSAGLNLWIPIANEREVAERLFEAGWLVRPGHDFCLTAPAGIRVTTARMTSQQSLAFVDALAAICGATGTTLSA